MLHKLPKSLGLLTAMVLAGCQQAVSSPTPASTDDAPVVDTGEGIVVSTGWGSTGVGVWVDPDTRCEYLIRYDKALTPRMEREVQTGVVTHRGCL